MPVRDASRIIMFVFSLSFAAGILITGCSTPTPTADPMQTALAETVAAELTKVAAEGLPTATVTAQPTDTVSSDISTPSATPTLVTPTPTSTPTETPTPTPTTVPEDPASILGNPDWKDTFDSASNWTLFDNECFKSNIEDSKFMMTGKMAVSCWEITWPVIKDYYLEVTVETTDSCPDGARFGLLFRAPDPSSGYLFGISCDGSYSLSSWVAELDAGETLVKPTQNDALNKGSNQVNRIGVMAEDNQYKLFINGVLVDEVEDDTFTDAGKFGLFIRAGNGDAPVKVYFDNIAYWNIK